MKYRKTQKEGWRETENIRRIRDAVPPIPPGTRHQAAPAAFFTVFISDFEERNMSEKMTLIYYANGGYAGGRDSDFEEAFGTDGNNGMIRRLYDLAQKERPEDTNRIAGRRHDGYVLFDPQDSSMVTDPEYWERTGRNWGGRMPFRRPMA